jgi:molecular chaperone DnaK (HSP70)
VPKPFKEEAEKIKIQLSSEEQVHISLPLVMTQANRRWAWVADFTRAQFEAMIDRRCQGTIDCYQTGPAGCESERRVI